jgi:hypothetical protein
VRSTFLLALCVAAVIGGLTARGLPDARDRTNDVVVRAGGRLFLRETLALCSPENKSLPAAAAARRVILQYQAAAQARGVALVVVPAPEAPVLYREDVWPGAQPFNGPAWSAAYREWYAALCAAGVDVVDVAPAIWSAKQSTAEMWPPQNSHWSPAATAVAGRFIGQHIRPLLGQYSWQQYDTRQVAQTIPSDFNATLPLADRAPPHTCVGQLVESAGQLVTGDDSAAVLLVGDSFSRIYSVPEGRIVPGADLGRHMALALGTPVQVIAENGKNPSETRALLLQRSAALRQKRVLVWEFAARWLLHPESWQHVEFPAP